MAKLYFRYGAMNSGKSTALSKIRSEFFYIKMGWSHSYFFVRGKCNTEGTMRNSIVIEVLNHCHDLGNSGFVICTEDGGSIGSNESSAF